MRRFLVPLACAALTSSLARAQTPVPPVGPAPAHDQTAPRVQALTLERAVQTALQRNPQLRVATAELEASAGAVRQADLAPNPVLGLEQEDTRAGTRTTTAQISQTLELGGKRAARVMLAQRAQDLAALDLLTRRGELRALTVQAFFDALTAQERVQVAEESLRIAGTGVDAAARRVTAGKVSPTEETRARVAQSGARIELRQAEAERSAALRVLAALMDAPDGSLQRLDGDVDLLPVVPSAADIAARLEDAPSVRRARLQVQQAEAGYLLARRQAVPDVTVGLGAKRAQELGRTQAVLTVSVPLPFFDRHQGAQLEALRKRDAAQASAEAEVLRLRSEVLQLADWLQARKDEVEILRRELLPGARSAYEAARIGFELGKFSFLDALDAQRTWLQVRGQYFAAVAQVHRHAAEIERLLGPVERP